MRAPEQNGGKMSDFLIEQTEQVDAEGSRTVAINGDMTIENAAELRSALMQALSDGGRLLLHMGRVDRIDLACLQLLCSAHRTAMRDEKHFSICGTDNEAIKDVIREAGFIRHTGCIQDIHKTCIWAGGERVWQR